VASNFRISTGQTFSIEVDIKHSGAAYFENENFVIELVSFDVEHFTPVNGLVQTLSGTELKSGLKPVWTLTAPDRRPTGSSQFIFNLNSVPRDVNSWQEAAKKFDTASLNVQVVTRTQLKLNAFLDEETQISIASVRTNSPFEVTVGLQNLGEAGIEGEYRVDVTSLPAGYTTDEPLFKTDSSTTIKWTIRAPNRVGLKPDTLRFKLSTPPLDEFARTDAYIDPDDSTAYVLVIPEAGAVITRRYGKLTKSAVAKGDTSQRMLGFELWNKGGTGSTVSQIRGIFVKFFNKKRQPIDPRTVVSRLLAVRSGAGEWKKWTSTFNSGHRVFLDFTQDPFIIVGNDPDSLEIKVDISSEASDFDFQVVIDSSSSILASDESGNELAIADSSGKNTDYLGFTSGISVIVEKDLEQTFCNYPNPFGSSAHPRTNFLYYLKEDSDFSIKVFTLTGELVKTWSFTRAEHPAQTSGGIHEGDIVWDGRNGQGSLVMNGIYIAYIVTQNGESAMTKIAVVK
jgi:hypothetical protein